MRKLFSLLSLLTLCAVVSCGGEAPTASEEEGIKACTLMAIYCPPECHQSEGGCPRQCHCPQYNACGPSLKCGQHEVCCTGAGPVNIDPSLNHYSCNPSGSMCPL
jgi:hypothetical protein